MSRIGNFIRTIDILAPDMTLNVNGKSSVKTIPGAFLSLVYLGVFIYVVVLQSITYFDTTSPTTLSSIAKEGPYSVVDVLADKHIPIIFMLDENDTTVGYDELLKYITPSLLIESYTDSGNFDMPVKYTQTNIPAVKCGDLKAAGKLDENYFINLGEYSKSIFEKGVCFDTTGLNTTILGSFSDIPSSTLTLAIFPCTLPDTSMCKDHSTIVKSFLQIIKLEATVNMAVKDKPVKYTANSDLLLRINPSIENLIRSNLISNEIIDQAGFLFPDVSVVNFTQVSDPFPNSGWRDTSKIFCTLAEISDFSCRPYLVNLVLSSNTKVKYSRNYKGLLETLGEIGGLKDLIFIMCFLFYSSYHEKASRAVLVRDTFKIKAPASCVNKKAKVSQTRNKWQMSGDCVKTSKAAEQKAWDDVESTLDVVRLVKEMATLRFIVEAFFSTSQRELIPTAMIVAATEEVDLRDLFLAENRPGPGPPTQKSINVKPTIATKTASFQTHLNNVAIGDTANPGMAHSLDITLGRSLRHLASDYILQTAIPVMSTSHSTSRPMNFDIEDLTNKL